MGTARGFGVAGSMPAAMVREVAAAVEAGGHATFWANDIPGGDGLAALAEAAAVTTRIGLGVGVVPLDRRPAEAIAARIAELGLPVGRLTVGVGSGGATDALARVRAGVEALRAASGARVIVGALGPRMTALAGEAADGALLNWLTPGQARRSASVVRAAAEAAGQPSPFVAAYVRVALGAAGIERFGVEADRYASFPSYAAHFARMGVAARETGVVGDRPEEIDAGLDAFADDALDEVVARAIVGEEAVAGYLDLVRAATPGRKGQRAGAAW